MAPPLRKKLSKKNYPGAPAAKPQENNSSPENLAPTPTTCSAVELPRRLPQDTPALTPEHTRSLRARESSNNSTPPQSLLERYKRSAARTQLTTSIDNMDKATRPAAVSPVETRTFNSIEFEMMRQDRAQANKLPHSQSTAASPEDFDMPQGLTIRKVTHSDGEPSSQGSRYYRSTSSAPLTGKLASEEQTCNSEMSECESTKPEKLLSDIPPPLNLHKSAKKISSYRKATQEASPDDTSSPIAVRPPPYNDNMPAGFQWISTLPSTSRPSDPWGWMKKWTCCQCANLDPTGRDRPAQTMVEQTTCARLTCKHERCAAGCRMLGNMPGPR